jgi:phospholipid/cholesterol/gamma-HCH transport system substrate-binding protein
MAGQAEKYKIGLFVIAGMVLLVLILLWLGASRVFEDSKTVVAYFSESVQGLERDSPVKFRGVPVGRVKDIRMAPDGRLIEVIIGLHRNFNVTKDLGLKMNLLGLTGMKYLELDTFTAEQAREPTTLDFEPRYPVLATYPSDFKEFGSALDNIFQKVKTVDLEKISHHLLNVTARIDRILAEGKFEKIGPDAADAIREIKEATKKINDEVTRAQISKQFGKTFEKANEFLDESIETARSANRMIRRTDNNLNRLSQKLDRSADNLYDFTRMIRQKPSSILFGSDEKAAPKR